MKKKLVGLGLVMAMFFIFGCATIQEHVDIQIDQESQEVIARITARHAGNELMKRYPDIAEKVAIVCRDIVKEKNPDIIVTFVNSITKILADDYIKDSLLKADIKEILGMIKIKTGVEITENQMAIIKAVAEGLISGIEIYKK